jgi:hypothetical protein
VRRFAEVGALHRLITRNPKGQAYPFGHLLAVHAIRVLATSRASPRAGIARFLAYTASMRAGELKSGVTRVLLGDRGLHDTALYAVPILLQHRLG